MLRDFELIQHQFWGGHDITIIPISDVHLGSPECMEQEFISFVRTVRDTPNTYLVIGGDLIENGTRSSIGDSVFRQTMPPGQQKREMANILSEVKDRILCFVPGNHERRSGKDADDDPVYDIAAKLDLEHLYRENIAFVKVQMGKPETENGKMNCGTNRPTYVLVVTHGAGGGNRGGRSYRGGSYDGSYDGGSYARGRGRNARRDSMGRYSRDYRGGSYERGYSRDGKEEYKQQLMEMMETAPDEQTRQNIKRMLDSM